MSNGDRQASPAGSRRVWIIGAILIALVGFIAFLEAQAADAAVPGPLSNLVNDLFWAPKRGRVIWAALAVALVGLDNRRRLIVVAVAAPIDLVFFLARLPGDSHLTFGNGPFLALLGLGAWAAWRWAEPLRTNTLKGVALGFALVAGTKISDTWLMITTRTRPMVIDQYVQNADHALGNLSWHVGVLLDRSGWLVNLVVETVYIELPVAAMAIAIFQLRRGWPSHHIVRSFLLVGLIGPLFYLLFPVVGPIYAYGSEDNNTTEARVGSVQRGLADETGEFVRDADYIEDRITADGRDGWPVEAGRYRLVVSRACPWANRAIIVRRLLGLEEVLGMAIAGPTHDERSWEFDLDPDGLDPVLGIPRLKDAFEKRFPGYPKGITVPAIVDVPTGQVVTNDYPQITLDLSGEWREFHREGAPDLYPEPLRDEMDEVMQVIYKDVNNGVYAAGFSRSQEAYERAYNRLFDRLDWVSDRLAGQRFLMGDTITEADVRLFTTLARFDAVYHGHFKCNRSKLTEMPVLWAYARDLFQTPGFGDTTDFQHIKEHYYVVHTSINPTQVVPAGPDLANWLEPHDRESLGGRPFGDGTPPGPPPPAERVTHEMA